ncbi:MAG: LEA type 2 family protein [Desulfatirhabdiaceae bacterium]
MRKVHKLHFAILSMAVIFIFISSCSLTGKNVESPRVTVSKIKIEDINLFEAVLRIEMRVFNVNARAFDIKGIDCELNLEQTRLATGVSNTPTHIPSFETATIPMTVYSSIDDISQCIREMKSKNKISFKIKGKLFLEGGLLKPSMVAFNSDGEISLEGIKALNL